MAASQKCVWVVLGNADPDAEEDHIPKALECADRLQTFLRTDAVAEGLRPRPEAVFFAGDKTVEEIVEHLFQAATYMKDHHIKRLFLYYAGHALAGEDDPWWTVIEPITGGGRRFLIAEVMRAVQETGLTRVRAVLFLDCCAFQTDEALEDPGMRPDAASGNEFLAVPASKYDQGVRDGCLFQRALEHCLRHSFQDLRFFIKCVQELAKQLSFGRLCNFGHDEPEELHHVVRQWPLSDSQREQGIFENTSFLRFALDIWTDNLLDPDDWQMVEDVLPVNVDTAINLIRNIADLYEAKPQCWNNLWWELDIIQTCRTLKDVRKKLSEGFEDHRRPGELTFRVDVQRIPAEVRRAVVHSLQKKFMRMGGEVDDAILWDVRRLLNFLGQLIETCESTCEKLEADPGQQHMYALYVRGLDTSTLREEDMQSLRDEINDLCASLSINVRVYLARGSLWALLCADSPLSEIQRRRFSELLFTRIKADLQARFGNRCALPQLPQWRPVHAVPPKVFAVVEEFERLVPAGEAFPSHCFWLRASDLRNIVAQRWRLDVDAHTWRILIFQEGQERKGHDWLQGSGPLKLACVTGTATAFDLGWGWRRQLQKATSPELFVLTWLAANFLKGHDDFVSLAVVRNMIDTPPKCFDNLVRLITLTLQAKADQRSDPRAGGAILMRDFLGACGLSGRVGAALEVASVVFRTTASLAVVVPFAVMVLGVSAKAAVGASAVGGAIAGVYRIRRALFPDVPELSSQAESIRDTQPTGPTDDNPACSHPATTREVSALDHDQESKPPLKP